jgi:hypothetical protein
MQKLLALKFKSEMLQPPHVRCTRARKETKRNSVGKHMANDDVICVQISLWRKERQRMLFIRRKVYLPYVDARIFSPSSLYNFRVTYWSNEKCSQNNNEQLWLLKQGLNAFLNGTCS